MKSFYALLLIGCVAAAPHDGLKLGAESSGWASESGTKGPGGLYGAAGGLGELLSQTGFGANAALTQLGGDKDIQGISEWASEAGKKGPGGLYGATGGLGKMLQQLGFGLNSLMTQTGGDKAIEGVSGWATEAGSKGIKGGLNGLLAGLNSMLSNGVGPGAKNLLTQIAGDQ